MLRLVFSLLVCSTCSVFGYNLEDRLPLYKRGPEKSTFGFSLTMHKTSAGQQSKINIVMTFVPVVCNNDNQFTIKFQVKRSLNVSVPLVHVIILATYL